MRSFGLPFVSVDKSTFSSPGINQHLEIEVTPIPIFCFSPQTSQAKDGPILYAGGNRYPKWPLLGASRDVHQFARAELRLFAGDTDLTVQMGIVR